MSTMASKITSLTIIYATVYSGADEKKTSTLRVTGLSPVTGQFPAQGPVTRKMFPFDDVIMHWHFGASIGDKRPTHNFLHSDLCLHSFNRLRVEFFKQKKKCICIFYHVPQLSAGS